MELHAGECVALHGPSGAGKSTLMRSIYANYRASAGRILVRHEGMMVDMASANPRTVLEVRRRTLGYVSQFLRVVPRVAALDIVAEAAGAMGSKPPPCCGGSTCRSVCTACPPRHFPAGSSSG